jgi:hypothetical protein
MEVPESDAIKEVLPVFSRLFFFFLCRAPVVSDLLCKIKLTRVARKTLLLLEDYGILIYMIECTARMCPK